MSYYIFLGQYVSIFLLFETQIMCQTGLYVTYKISFCFWFRFTKNIRSWLKDLGFVSNENYLFWTSLFHVKLLKIKQTNIKIHVLELTSTLLVYYITILKPTKYLWALVQLFFTTILLIGSTTFCFETLLRFRFQVLLQNLKRRFFKNSVESI